MLGTQLQAGLFVIFAVLVQSNASAAVYKSVNEDGNTVFSDTSSPTAKEIKIPEPVTYSTQDLPSSHQTTKKPTQVAIRKYSKLEIKSVTGEDAVRSNTGLAELNVTITPAPQQGHTIELTLDGKVNQTITGSGVVALSNLDRGAHLFQLQVKAANKVIQSGPVFTLNILRYSIPRHQVSPR